MAAANTAFVRCDKGPPSVGLYVWTFSARPCTWGELTCG
jgi:hypothetical protein